MNPLKLSLLPVFLILPGFCFSADNPPTQPVVVAPPDNATNISTNTNLILTVSDPESNPLNVTFYGRQCPAAAGADFTIMGLPDTQYYTGEINGGTNAIYKSQMNWIINHRTSDNIVFMEGLGDCVQNADVQNEWKRTDTCMKIIENPVTTSLTYGLPYGINVGNHDQVNGVAGATTSFNSWFGVSRFTGRSYYGGHYGTTNDNNYVLFSASGMDFIVINLEYNSSIPVAIITWMTNLLTTYSNRHAIIGSHTMISQQGQFGAEGQTIYNAVKNYPNVFLMLCGHLTEEAKRQDTYNGHTITTLLSDYQARTNGGNGWFRIMKFSPVNNTISVKTYSPWLNQYETDTNSQFTINYNMQPFFTIVGSSSSVNSGSTISMPWNNLAANTCYQWYATVSDGNSTITSPVSTFTTASTSSAVTISFKVFIEGFYRGNGTMASVSNAAVCDTVTLELHNTTSPYGTVQSVRHAISTSGTGDFLFSSGVYGGSYYLVVKHRNSLETWSALPVLLNGTTKTYDFTTGKNKAFGNKLKDLNDGRFAVYSGDVNQNGLIDMSDYSTIESSSHSFITGYNLYDITGDKIVETADYSLLENNVSTGIILSRP